MRRDDICVEEDKEVKFFRLLLKEVGDEYEVSPPIRKKITSEVLKALREKERYRNAS
jgi:hypothetical protein